MEFFDIPNSIYSNFPSRDDRENNANIQIHAKQWNGLNTMSYKRIDTLLCTLCPGPSRGDLQNSIVARLHANAKKNESLPYKYMLESMMSNMFCIMMKKDVKQKLVPSSLP